MKEVIQITAILAEGIEAIEIYGLFVIALLSLIKIV
jgi:hypothetical protein